MKNRQKQVAVKALTAILEHLNNPNHKHEFSAKWLQKHGMRTNTAFGRLLLSKMLIPVCMGYTPGQHSKTYKLNEVGVIELAQQVGIDIDEVLIDRYQEKYADVLESGFTDTAFTDKSNRLWNGIQFVKKDIKKKLLPRHGYMHDYDIQCCHPTLLYQYAQYLDETLHCPVIEQMLTDRSMFRQSIAETVGISDKTVKKIINSLFNAGKLGINYRFSIYRDDLNCNDKATLKLMENTLVRGLREDIRAMWLVIKKHRKIDLRSGREKSAVARELEREVLNVVKKFMNRNNNQFIPEHDGWKCKFFIDEDMLIREIKNKTGFRVKLDGTHYNELGEVVSDTSTSDVSAISSIPSFANAHSDIDSLPIEENTCVCSDFRNREMTSDIEQSIIQGYVTKSLYYDCTNENNSTKTGDQS